PHGPGERPAGGPLRGAGQDGRGALARRVARPLLVAALLRVRLRLAARAGARTLGALRGHSWLASLGGVSLPAEGPRRQLRELFGQGRSRGCHLFPNVAGGRSYSARPLTSCFTHARFSRSAAA